jgi:hypothetical protein
MRTAVAVFLKKRHALPDGFGKKSPNAVDFFKETT